MAATQRIGEAIAARFGHASSARPGLMAGIGQSVRNFRMRKAPWAIFDLDQTTFAWRQEKSDALPYAFTQAGWAAKKAGIDVPPPTREEWIPWTRELGNDEANPIFAAEWKKKRKTHRIGVITSRDDLTLPEGTTGRSITEGALARHGLRADKLVMRGPDNFGMATAPYKAAMLDRHFAGARITDFYDDEDKILDMARERGIATHKAEFLRASEIPAAQQLLDATQAVPERRMSTARRKAMERWSRPGKWDDPAWLDPDSPVNFKR